MQRPDARGRFWPKRHALTNALNSAGPGDTIKLRKGNWSDVHLVVNRGGYEGWPLEIMPKAPGEVVLCGFSDLAINAPYVTVDGLFFYRGAIKSGSVISFNSQHGIVRNTAVVDYNPPLFETQYYWVFFNGDNNLLDHCYFKGKNNLQPLIGNALENSRYNRVRQCYFKKIPYAEPNGREDIRVWGSGKFDPNDRTGRSSRSRAISSNRPTGKARRSSPSSRTTTRSSTTPSSPPAAASISGKGSHNLIKGNVILGRGLDRAQGLAHFRPAQHGPRQLCFRL